MRARSVLVALLVLVAASPLTAQEEPVAEFAERVEVELVNVEFWATDKTGRPVTGLTPEDLVIRHDGREVPIEFFTEMRDGRPTSGESAAPLARSDVSAANHLVVYFDELNLHPRNRRRTIEALGEALDGRVVDPERVLILRQTRGLSVVAPFGSDRSAIELALAELTEEGSTGAGALSPFDRALREIEELWTTSQDTAGSAATGLAGIPNASTLSGLSETGGSSPSGTVGGAGAGSGGGGLAGDACEIMVSRVEPLIVSLTRERSAQIAATLERLSEAITFLAGLDGVKTLLYVGDRLESSPGGEVARVVQRYCPTSQPGYLMEALAADMSSDFLAMSRHANANRVTFYALQPEGLAPRGASSIGRRGERRGGAPSSEALRQDSERGGLLTLSGETGGRVIHGRNDLEGAIDEVAREMLNYYSLAFQPPATHESARHQVEVEAKSPGVRIRHRRGYLEKSADERLREKLLGALNLGLVSNPLGVRLAAEPIRQTGEGSFVLPLRVLVPADSLVPMPMGEESMGGLVLKLIVHDQTAGTLQTIDRRVRVRLPKQPGGQWVPLDVDLARPAGVHTVAVGVVDEVSGETAYVSTTLEIGAEGE